MKSAERLASELDIPVCAAMEVQRDTLCSCIDLLRAELHGWNDDYSKGIQQSLDALETLKQKAL